MAKILLGSDHAGYELKEEIKKYLASLGFLLEDKGSYNAISCDYPDFAKKVCTIVAQDPAQRGILVCGTGIGMCIAANKMPGIRAALCHNEFEAEMSRRHNDANVICLGARSMPKDVAIRLIDKFLREGFESQAERHVRRVKKVMDIEGVARDN